MTAAPNASRRPDVSFVMPAYNEEEVIVYTIPQLLAAFEKAGYNLELVAVDNGSKDGTGRIIQEFIAKGMNVVHHRVDVNQGYGWGVLCGLPRATAPWVGIIPADGQVDPDDVVRLFEAVRFCKGWVIGKVRRRFRLDGFLRKVVSVAYNCFVYMLWPKLGSIDINGSPKLLQRQVIDVLDLQSKQWFLDPEIMVKSHYLGVRVLEMNVFARMRGNGLSHVRATTCWEFFRNLLRFRFSRALRGWRRQRAGALPPVPNGAASASPEPVGASR